MEKHSDQPQDLPISEAMRLAATPQGQQILKQLQEQHGDLMQSAIQRAQSGDYTQVKQMISSLLQSPDGKALLDNLRR